ncbi:LysR family transcriptional regulator [Mycobacterium sp. 141]|uniref:LysR family transcriptional regulator n=1 Tax=Mycobacterium sp. 141 TaxID=1120797 RepID=UPI0003747245|nr:LysR family transcriptional regulator [Mycobacterium sp. 141]
MKSLDSVDLNLLRTFRTVVATKSMARAASDLGYVPSAVSQHISRLEQMVGVQLITRAPGEPVAPTAAGRHVADAAAELLAAAADFANACHSLGSGTISLKVAAYATATSELLPAVISAIKKTDPTVHIGVIEAEPADGLPLLAAGSADLLIAYRYLPDELPLVSRVRETELGRERLPVVRTVDAPERLPWVAGAPHMPSRRLLEHWAASTGSLLDIRYEVEGPQGVLALAAHGLCQGIVPISIVHSHPGPAIATEDLKISGVPLHRTVVALTRQRYEHPLSTAICSEIARILAAFG